MDFFFFSHNTSANNFSDLPVLLYSLLFCTIAWCNMTDISLVTLIIIPELPLFVHSVGKFIDFSTRVKSWKLLCLQYALSPSPSPLVRPRNWSNMSQFETPSNIFPDKERYSPNAINRFELRKDHF